MGPGSNIDHLSGDLVETMGLGFLNEVSICLRSARGKSFLFLCSVLMPFNPSKAVFRLFTSPTIGNILGGSKKKKNITDGKCSVSANRGLWFWCLVSSKYPEKQLNFVCLNHELYASYWCGSRPLFLDWKFWFLLFEMDYSFSFTFGEFLTMYLCEYDRNIIVS